MTCGCFLILNPQSGDMHEQVVVKLTAAPPAGAYRGTPMSKSLSSR